MQVVVADDSNSFERSAELCGAWRRSMWHSLLVVVSEAEADVTRGTSSGGSCTSQPSARRRTVSQPVQRRFPQSLVAMDTGKDPFGATSAALLSFSSTKPA